MSTHLRHGIDCGIDEVDLDLLLEFLMIASYLILHQRVPRQRGHDPMTFFFGFFPPDF